ncbi:MAG: hypothetical protein FD127_253 [Acidimicrobiaceae bacterium]|nr:MAG: hypothetical protein FD127_253 [Acidimicrobiaceae bacterium]
MCHDQLMRLASSLGLGAALVVAGCLAAGIQQPSAVGAAEVGYVALPSPARVLDTRSDGATVDGQFQRGGIRPLGSTLALTVAGRAGVPSDATAVVLNVTVTEATGSGYVTVYPCGATQPTASNLNYVSGKNIPNLVIAKVGTAGQACLFNTAPTQLIVDVAGYFPGTDALAPLDAPARLLDTRPDGITIDGIGAAGGIRGAGTVQTLQIAGRAGISAGVSSVVLNVTVDQPDGSGYITVYPCDAARPTASNVNYVLNQTIPNAAIAKVAADGTVCFFTSRATHLIVDAAGYFADASVLVPLPAPARLLDSRSGGATIDGLFQATGFRPSGGTIQLTVAGRAGIPATASAVVLNVTVDQAQTEGYITVYPTGVARPNASNLNYVIGQTVPNAVIARLGSGGTICLYSSGATHLIVDVAGYLIGPAPAAPGSSCPADPLPPAPQPPGPTPTTQPPGGGLDPRYPTCTAAKAAGYGPYVFGVDPEYAWYEDRDHDGIVCE